jgi:hypothetical protein
VAVNVAVIKKLVAVKGPEVAVFLATRGSEGLQGYGNTVSAVALGETQFSRTKTGSINSAYGKRGGGKQSATSTSTPLTRPLSFSPSDSAPSALDGGGGWGAVW